MTVEVIFAKPLFTGAFQEEILFEPAAFNPTAVLLLVQAKVDGAGTDPKA